MAIRSGFALAASLLITASVAAQEITMTGGARSATLFQLLVKYCPQVNGDLATRYAMAFNSVGAKTYGNAVFEKEISRVLPLRETEIREAGKVQWCAQHIAAAEKMGIKEIRSKK